MCQQNEHCNTHNNSWLMMYSVSFLKVSLFIDAQLLINTFSAGRVPDHFGSSNSVLIKDQCSSNIVLLIGGRGLSCVSLQWSSCMLPQ